MSLDKGGGSFEQIERINLVRGSFYSFLSRAFKAEVDGDFLREIAAAGATIRQLTESQEKGDLMEGSERLGQFIQHVASMSDDEKQSLMTDLRLEFTTLFMGLGQDTVHLVESAYAEEEHLRYDKPAQDVQAAYQSVGFKKNAEFTEPEDHFALEFEFMARLCDWTAQNLGKNDVENTIAYLSLQKEFLRDHIIRWVPKLTKRLKRKAKSEFYSSLAYLTSGFVENDEEIPSHLIALLKGNLSTDAGS